MILMLRLMQLLVDLGECIIKKLLIAEMVTMSYNNFDSRKTLNQRDVINVLQVFFTR